MEFSFGLDTSVSLTAASHIGSKVLAAVEI
jgi:hypothetical protein